MINVRALLTGIVLGAVAALLIHELFRFGLSFTQWTVRGAKIGEILVTGALIGTVSQIVGQTRGRR